MSRYLGTSTENTSVLGSLSGKFIKLGFKHRSNTFLMFRVKCRWTFEAYIMFARHHFALGCLFFFRLGVWRTWWEKNRFQSPYHMTVSIMQTFSVRKFDVILLLGLGSSMRFVGILKETLTPNACNGISKSFAFVADPIRPILRCLFLFISLIKF